MYANSMIQKVENKGRRGKMRQEAVGGRMREKEVNEEK